MASEEEACEPPAHAELWGGLDRDLERLQGVLDHAAEQLGHSFTSLSNSVNSDLAADPLRARFRDEVGNVITSLQFHDAASQMIMNMRARAILLEAAALTGTPGEMLEVRSRLLEEALHLSNGRPAAHSDRNGEVELF